ncbi:bacteriocin immunity protein [Streptomyces tardus]|nr:bacteriocin immunity protein [Streptomyces tardus]
MERVELVRIVERIMNVEGTEEEQDALIELLEKHFPHPRVLGLIFCSDPELSAEEVVDAALTYRAFEL